MRVYVVEPDGTELDAHYFEGAAATPDRFGKRECFRCHPGDKHNESGSGVYYRSIEDLPDHLRGNPDWSVRVTKASAPTSLRHKNVHIDGLPR